MNWDEDAYDVQLDTVEWLRHRTMGFIWLKLGAGKTISMLTAVMNMWSRFPALHGLMVVGPKLVVEETWPEEIEGWDHTRHLTYGVYSGTVASREHAIAKNPDVLLVGYSHLREVYKLKTELPNVLCLDEIHRMSAHDSERLKDHIKNRRRFQRTFGMTGTPAREGYIKLWAQEAALTRKPRLGKNITSFRERFCSRIKKGVYDDYVVGPYSAVTIETLLDPITWNPDPATYADLRKPVVFDIEVGWTKKLRETYVELEKEFIVEVENLEEGGMTTVEAVNAAVGKNKLRQLCGGCLYHEGKPMTLDFEKMQAMDEAMLAMNGEAVLLFYQFKWERQEIIHRLKQQGYVVDTPHSKGWLERWNAAETDVLVAHPESAGEGLNLHKTCRTILWYSIPWSGRAYDQAIGRIDRGHAQPFEVRIYRLLRKKSVDLDIAELQEEKAELEGGLMRRVGRRHAV